MVSVILFLPMSCLQQVLWRGSVHIPQINNIRNVLVYSWKPLGIIGQKNSSEIPSLPSACSHSKGGCNDKTPPCNDLVLSDLFRPWWPSKLLSYLVDVSTTICHPSFANRVGGEEGSPVPA